MNKTEGERTHECSKIDCFLEKLPAIHIFKYKYCGINTNLSDRFAHNDVGINELDCACMEHDIAYAESTNPESRCKADQILVLKAIKRIYAKDSQFSERIIAMIVSGLIYIKMILAKIEICVNRVRMGSTKKIKRNKTITKQCREEQV